MMHSLKDTEPKTLSVAENKKIQDAANGCKGLKSYVTVKLGSSVIKNQPIVIKAAYYSYLTAVLSHRADATLRVIYTYKDIATGDVLIDTVERILHPGNQRGIADVN